MIKLPRVRAKLARLGGIAPRPTIRLRLTVTYGIVFLITGAVLLTIGYAVVRHNIGGLSYKRRLNGIGFPSILLPRPPVFGPLPRELEIAREVHRQLVGAALHRLVGEYVLALGLMTLISVAAGWLLAGRALRPLRQITATARRVSSQNLGERIALSGPADELKELADTFDGMLGRLDGAFASQRHFVANASHELRTPLAIMRTEVDVALADPEAEIRELRAMGEAVRETVDRCERLIEALLMLARSEAAVGPEESVDIAALVGDCVTDLRARAQAAQVEVRADLAPARVRGDARLLERLAANLLDNGIRHNEPGGFLAVSTRVTAAHVELTVANGGSSIDPADAATLTEPFRRLDRSYGGFGLGLSIVGSIAEASGGRAVLTAREAGGLEVRIELPLAAVRPDAPAARAGASALTRS